MYPKWYIIVPSICWAGAVGYSRMHLGVHYPSDVVAGALVGAGSAWLTHYVNKKLIAKSK
jgi:membrane-associated phospholipid phosphatase